MAFQLPAARAGAAQLVEYLADPHRYAVAYNQLIQLGASARAAARQGLSHGSPRVRAQCCRILDHLMDAEASPR